jgi:hypothetical protein
LNILKLKAMIGVPGGWLSRGIPPSLSNSRNRRHDAEQV